MVTIDNLSFSYRKHKVFENLCLNLECGKIYGLLGENGVGKSTLLKILSGLIRPESGSCAVAGMTPFDREPAFLERIFYLQEQFVAPKISISRYAMELGNFYPNFSHDDFYCICNEFGIDPECHFNKLSLGQQKKAMIAVAVSLHTDILLMDEPTNGLDIPSKAIFRKLIAQSASDDRLIVISTHQVKDLENMIDPIIILDKDGVLMNASIDEIAEKLSFSIEQELDCDTIYTQHHIGGYFTVRRNDSGYETPVDIEVLFNCAMHNKMLFNELFTNKR